MEAIPAEWIDKLFACMEEFYGQRWIKNYDVPSRVEMQKTMWRSGLIGLSYEQIKAQLYRCKRHAEDPRAVPPHMMEFFRYAKNATDIVIDYHPDATKQGDPNIAKEHLAIIRNKLGLRSNASS